MSAAVIQSNPLRSQRIENLAVEIVDFAIPHWREHNLMNWRRLLRPAFMLPRGLWNSVFLAVGFTPTAVNAPKFGLPCLASAEKTP